MKEPVVALLGNPNVGKTRLFNQLTASREFEGNWAGVTVDCHEGNYQHKDQRVNCVDLPGTYSLSASDDGHAFDQKFVCDYMQNNYIDVVVNVVDARALERNLYVTCQLLLCGYPVIVVLNGFEDKKSLAHIDIKQLEDKLGCPVIPLSVQSDIKVLKSAIFCYRKKHDIKKTKSGVPSGLKQLIDDISSQIISKQKQVQYANARLMALRYLEFGPKALPAGLAVKLDKDVLCQVTGSYSEDIDTILAGFLYDRVCQITKSVHVHENIQSEAVDSNIIDKIVLHRFWGVPIFFLMMYVMFFFYSKK